MMAFASLPALAPRRSVLTLLVLLVGVVAGCGTLASFRLEGATPPRTAALVLVSLVGHGVTPLGVVDAGKASTILPITPSRIDASCRAEELRRRRSIQGCGAGACRLSCSQEQAMNERQPAITPACADLALYPSKAAGRGIFHLG
jgi:hypothetical protein